VPSPLEIVHVLFLERKILVSLIADHSTRRKLDLRVKMNSAEKTTKTQSGYAQVNRRDLNSLSSKTALSGGIWMDM
jgi:hypothetical protein